jgi:hypothetical protein
VNEAAGRCECAVTEEQRSDLAKFAQVSVLVRVSFKEFLAAFGSLQLYACPVCRTVAGSSYISVSTVFVPGRKFEK